MLPQGSGKLVSGAISFSRSCYPVTMHSVKALWKKGSASAHKVVFFEHRESRDVGGEDEATFENLNLKNKEDTSCANGRAIQL